jgi:hypothetical protein
MGRPRRRPDVHGWITYLWVPPFTGDRVGRRLREQYGNVNDLIEAVEREGAFEAQRIMAMDTAQQSR